MGIINKSHDEYKAPQSVRNLIETYEGLNFTRNGILDGGDDYLFLETNSHTEVSAPENIAHILSLHDGKLYFMISANTDLPDYWTDVVSASVPEFALAEDTTSFIPTTEAEDGIKQNEIIKTIDEYRSLVAKTKALELATELLERERCPESGMFASAMHIDETAPMLIEGLVRERGVSVFYGDFDEFKTTLVMDMMAHVATGAMWQGRTVTPRPVYWYALEGQEEVPVRLRALETRLKENSTPWGEEHIPMKVFDRIPDSYKEWRHEICQTSKRWQDFYDAREKLGELPGKTFTTELDDGTTTFYINPDYPNQNIYETPPIIVIDTLSIALGGEDEKGAKAVSFINDCLDLLKERPDLGCPFDFDTNPDEADAWYDKSIDLAPPAAAHVIIIHHQTKTGKSIAGHRAISADTHGLYRVHRHGNISDTNRPYAGQLTPIRVKGIPRPAPMRFEVEVVPVEGTKRNAAILKDKAKEIPQKLHPIIEALRELDELTKLTDQDVNECIDKVANNRTSRSRYKKELEAAGVLESIEDDNGNAAFYLFHDTKMI